LQYDHQYDISINTTTTTTIALYVTRYNLKHEHELLQPTVQHTNQTNTKPLQLSKSF